MRNRVVHGYWSIDLDILVTAGRDDIGRSLGVLLAEIGAEGRVGMRPLWSMSSGLASYAVAMSVGASDLGSLIERHRTEILALVRRYRGRSIAVFGSVARGEATPDSDVDFLVEFEPASSLLDLIHLEEALTTLLGVDVDVISAGALLERDVEIRDDAVAL